MKAGSPHRTKVPHPERCAESMLGNEDGRLIFLSVLEALKEQQKVGA